MTAVFDDDVDIYFARQQVAERLREARESLPPGAEPKMGPISTGLGEIYMWTVEYAHPHGAGAGAGRRAGLADATAPTSRPRASGCARELERAAYLRTVQDWIIRPQLKSVPGVAGVDAIGGYVKQYQVQPDPRSSSRYGLTFGDVDRGARAQQRQHAAPAIIEHNGEAYVVRADGRHRDARRDRATIVVATRDGVPIRVRDVAERRDRRASCAPAAPARTATRSWSAPR